MNKISSPGRRSALAAGIGSLALLAACSERGRFFALPGGGGDVFHGLTMGSTYTVKIATRGLADATLAAAQSAVATALADVVGRMSHYDAASEVSRLNRHPVGEPFAASAPTLRVFAAAQAVRAASGGAFDVAVGRAVDEWGFGPSERQRRVLPAQSVQALQHLHRDGALVLDMRAGTLTRHTLAQANLSGIAKGYGVDRAAQALDALGITDYMVEVGGEIRTRGHNAEGRPWQLAVERPDAMPRRALRVVPLAGKSLATSGDYRNFFIHERSALLARDRSGQRGAGGPCAGLGQRGRRRLHPRRRLVDGAVRARTRARPGHRDTPGPGRLLRRARSRW